MTFLEEYTRTVNKDAVSKSAFDYLITDLLQKKLVGNDKIRTLTGVDMERGSPTNFVPSMIYVMMYHNNKSDGIVQGKNFYDVVPLILCLSCDLKYVTGINFNFVPNEIRAKILDLISSDGIVDNIVNSDSNDFKINQKLGTRLMSGNVTELISYLKETTGVDISMCIRKYDRKNIINSRLIEYDMWMYIPFLNFNDAVRGVNLVNVQVDMIKSSNK